MFHNLQYCIRCCIPETQEGVNFDDFGICQACRASEEKLHIDWKSRQEKLEKILSSAKSQSKSNYDCIVPISGGKDSTFQLHVLVNVYKMKPLAVTFNHNWFSEIGLYNLYNSLEQFNVDHIMFTPNRSLVNKLAKRSLDKIGDTCWHCHAGCGTFPLKIAIMYKIPLMVWGESAAESSGRDSYKDQKEKFDREYFFRISAKSSTDDMICDYLSEKDLSPFKLPSAEEYEKVGIKGIYLGDYIFWDDERQTEFIKKKYGWKETDIEGTYKGYKSAECVMPGMHDFTCYLKRGFGRSTFHAGVDIRNGLLTRKEGFELVEKYDSEEPNALDYYLRVTGLTREEFYKTMKKHRLGKLKNTNIPIKFKNKDRKKKIVPFIEEFIKKQREI